MKKVLTVGVYDYFHLGHLRLFYQAKEHGDYLIVAVQDEAYIRKYKPQTSILYSTSQRVEIISALSIVDEVKVYSDIDKSISEIDFDVFAVGEDQSHDGFIRAIEWCKKNGKKVVRLKRTPGISSLTIKKTL